MIFGHSSELGPRWRCPNMKNILQYFYKKDAFGTYINHAILIDAQYCTTLAPPKSRFGSVVSLFGPVRRICKQRRTAERNEQVTATAIGPHHGVVMLILMTSFFAVDIAVDIASYTAGGYLTKSCGWWVLRSCWAWSLLTSALTAARTLRSTCHADAHPHRLPDSHIIRFGTDADLTHIDEVLKLHEKQSYAEVRTTIAAVQSVEVDLQRD
ncbi:hypothetical protein ON010_g10238 [Phytophthora cinnamomi]|nr:hypothetical protein ON010_g10238 [Phytophthora cinnamomi]